MDQATQRLTDFLSARLDEDEAVAYHGDGGLMEDAHFSQARVLAEVAAKRQLLERPFPRASLPILASVYADHPDYQAEWAVITDPNATAEAERDALAQAMWDGWAALGFDTDGDSGPAAQIAGARFTAGGSSPYVKWAESWLRDVRRHRQDDDEALDECISHDQEIVALRSAVTNVKAEARAAAEEPA